MAGVGAKGQRWYDWARIELRVPGEPGWRWLLVRGNWRTGELAFYRCYCPHPVPLATLVRIAGRRWTVEECFQTGKGLAGLDEHQVRCWTCWHRWVTLAMLAAAFLSILAITEQRCAPAPAGLIPFDLQRDPASVHYVEHRAGL